MGAMKFLFDPSNGAILNNIAYPLSLVSYSTYFTQPAFANALGNWAGFTSGGYVATPGTFVPNYARGWSEDGAIFSFAGTNSWSQLLGYVLLSAQCNEPNFGFFARVARWAREMIEQLQPLVFADLLSIPAGAPVIFCGHSLGGAIALYFAALAKKILGVNVVRVCTFGAPRWCDGFLADQVKDLNINLIRNVGDFVPACPPAHGLPYNKANIFLTLIADFVHVRPGLYIDDDPRGFELSWDRWADGLLGTLGNVIVAGAPNDFGITVAANDVLPSTYLDFHRCATYCSRLQALSRRSHGLPNPLQLDAVFVAMETYANGVANGSLPPDAPARINYLNFVDPSVDPSTPPPTPTIPTPAPAPIDCYIVRAKVTFWEAHANVTSFNTPITAAAGQTPPGVGETHSEFQVGKGESHLFRGEDRRMILKSYLSINAMFARDDAAADPAPSTRLSTRQTMMDREDPDMVQAFDDVRQWLGFCLSLIYV